MSRHAYADYLMTVGRLEESIEQVRLGRTYDPDSAIASVIFVAHLRFGGRERDAIVEARRLLEASPRAAAVRGLLAEALWHQGQYDDALVEYRRVYGANHAVPAMLERELRRSGPRSALSAYARFLASQRSPSGSTLLMIAALYAQAGEVDAAMEWLEKAYGERVPQLLHVIVEPAFDGIRTDPRYAAMMERIGLRPR